MSISSSSSTSSASSDLAKSEKPSMPNGSTKSHFWQWNGTHALAIAAATIFGYWGYRLYVTGVSLQSAANLKASLPLSIKFDLSGTGPGILFMAFGAMVIMVALLTLKSPKEKKD